MSLVQDDTTDAIDRQMKEAAMNGTTLGKITKIAGTAADIIGTVRDPARAARNKAISAGVSTGMDLWKKYARRRRGASVSRPMGGTR